MTDLHKLFVEQVEKDNAQFGIESIYLPNPIFNQMPSYCFVAMEPSMGRMTFDVFRLRREQGFLNFLLSEEDFILNYCAYKYLCNDSFSYAITDISKGAMKTVLASKDRRARYKNWKPLLRQELVVLGEPKLISIGGAVKKFLDQENFQCEMNIRHFSLQNNHLFRKDYETSQDKHETEGIYLRLKEFARELLIKNNYTQNLSDWVLGKIFNKELSFWKKGLFINYKKAFSIIGDS